jgi:hypothetical protein
MIRCCRDEPASQKIFPAVICRTDKRPLSMAESIAVNSDSMENWRKMISAPEKTPVMGR